MATTINIEDILKAAQTMSKAERLKLIASIALLPENVCEPSNTASPDIANREVRELAKQFIDHHQTLLRRLAQ